MTDLRVHRLELVAARHWRATGRPVPPELARLELVIEARTHAMLQTVRAARHAYDGQMMLLKGLSVASRYPSAALRPSADIDLLVDDPHRAQASLLEAGFEPVGARGESFFDGLQHLRPLSHPGLGGIPVEVHSHVSWVRWTPPPERAEVFGAGVPSRLAVEDLLEPDPAHHAVILAAHASSTTPLRRLGDLLDVALMLDDTDAQTVARIADSWAVPELWRLYEEAIECVFGGAPTTRALRSWSKGLLEVRDDTVWENHLRRWMSPFWTRSSYRALPAAGLALYEDLTPAPGEGWANKSKRLRASVRMARRPVREHRDALGSGHIQARFTRRQT